MMVLPSSPQDANKPGYLGFQETEFTTSACPYDTNVNVIDTHTATPHMTYEGKYKKGDCSMAEEQN